ncbi:hypothetical protein [Hymenobacter chitinivorans]|uniref:YcxB-like protein n=1 Tax=Hymenobacter chitinivorans DSM 11115 TaxID=1121954 RepID=A0A2M9BMK5_9BACT|nr:hypothetical protein [Hymenobacter chitinivorans]PJJ59179.1 hypothetical protein CLV45_0594 [Hymenobacter chitinivorans DSM 11115]
MAGPALFATSIEVAPCAVSFAEFQAIHQEQQRRRYPDEKREPRPATSDPWKVKVQRWAAIVATGAALGFWFRPRAWVSWVVLVTVSSVLGLAYQWWEYHRAYRQLPSQQQATGFTVEPPGVRITQGGSSRFFRWVEFYSIQQVPGWVLLYTSVEQCYYLNLALVQAPATAEQVLALLPKPGAAAE